MNKNREGYRGYVGSRSYSGIDFPQQIQNFIIRNYCQKYKLHYLLSATEYKMPGCYMILKEILETLPNIQGIVLFSIFMLPKDALKRQSIYERLFESKSSLHAALEEITIHKEEDVESVEDLLRIHQITHTDESISILLSAVMNIKEEQTAVSF